jgi:cell division protease FtsH
MTEKSRNLWYFVVAVAAILLVQCLWTSRDQAATIPYSEFQRLLRDKKVSEISISVNQIRDQLKEPLAGGRSEFVTTRVEADLATEFEKRGVKFAGRIESTLLPTILSWAIPALIFVAIWVLVIKRAASRLGAGGGLMSIGKSKAKVFVEPAFARAHRRQRSPRPDQLSRPSC